MTPSTLSQYVCLLRFLICSQQLQLIVNSIIKNISFH
jgi:hypothetical protein